MTNVNNVTLEVNTDAALTLANAASTTINGTETFQAAPSRRGDSLVLLIRNGAGDQGALTYSIAPGDFWAATDALTGAVAQGVTKAINIEGAKYRSKTGAFAITLTPATGKSLATNHAAAVGLIELP